MRLGFLGDAFDYWKGSLFFRLQREGILLDFSVDPMLSDHDNWHASDFRVYADLLKIKPGQILHHKRKLREDRDQYFAEVIHTGDLFLDPDTGISLGYAPNPERYIRVKEIHQLLGEELTRILCIYQHIGREQTSYRVCKLTTALEEFGARIHCCSYETPNVAMLFISQNENRIRQVSDCFRNYLGQHSKRRIRLSR